MKRITAILMVFTMMMGLSAFEMFHEVKESSAFDTTLTQPYMDALDALSKAQEFYSDEWKQAVSPRSGKISITYTDAKGSPRDVKIERVDDFTTQVIYDDGSKATFRFGTTKDGRIFARGVEGEDRPKKVIEEIEATLPDLKAQFFASRDDRQVVKTEFFKGLNLSRCYSIKAHHDIVKILEYTKANRRFNDREWYKSDGVTFSGPDGVLTIKPENKYNESTRFYIKFRGYVVKTKGTDFNSILKDISKAL